MRKRARSLTDSEERAFKRSLMTVPRKLNLNDLVFTSDLGKKTMHNFLDTKDRAKLRGVNKAYNDLFKTVETRPMNHPALDTGTKKIVNSFLNIADMAKYGVTNRSNYASYRTKQRNVYCDAESKMDCGYCRVAPNYTNRRQCMAICTTTNRPCKRFSTQSTSDTILPFCRQHINLIGFESNLPAVIAT